MNHHDAMLRVGLVLIFPFHAIDLCQCSSHLLQIASSPECNHTDPILNFLLEGLFQGG